MTFDEWVKIFAKPATFQDWMASRGYVLGEDSDGNPRWYYYDSFNDIYNKVSSDTLDNLQNDYDSMPLIANYYGTNGPLPDYGHPYGWPDNLADLVINGIYYTQIGKFANNSGDPVIALKMEFDHLAQYGITPIWNDTYGWIAITNQALHDAHPIQNSNSIFDLGPVLLGSLLVGGIATGYLTGAATTTELAATGAELATTATTSGAELATLVESGTAGVEGAFLETAALSDATVAYSTVTGDLLSMTLPTGEVISYDAFSSTYSAPDLTQNVSEPTTNTTDISTPDLTQNPIDSIQSPTEDIPQIDTGPSYQDVVKDIAQTATKIPGTSIPMPSLSQITGAGMSLFKFAQQTLGTQTPKSGTPVALNASGKPIDAYGNLAHTSSILPLILIAGGALLLTS